MRAQRGPTHALRGPRNVHKEGFSRFTARIACFPKVSFGADQQIPIGLKAITLPSGIIFSARGSAREKTLEARQNRGKDSENSHFETQSADFLPRSQGDRAIKRLPLPKARASHRNVPLSLSQMAARQCAFPGRARHNPARETPPQSIPGSTRNRSASSPHLRNRRRRRAQWKGLRHLALRIGAKNGRCVDAAAPEGYGSRT